MKENAKNAEQLVMTTQRFFHGHPGPAIDWKIYIAPPAKAAERANINPSRRPRNMTRVHGLVVRARLRAPP